METNFGSAGLEWASNAIPVQLSQSKRQVEGLCLAIVSCEVAVDEASTSFEFHVIGAAADFFINGASASDCCLLAQGERGR